MERTKHIGVINLSTIYKYSLSGIILRAAGLHYDLRKQFSSNNLYAGVHKIKYLRLKVRSPGFFNLQSYNNVSRNLLLSDSLALLGSYDIVLGEIDR